MNLIEYHRGSTHEQEITLTVQAQQTHNYLKAMDYSSAGREVDRGVSTSLPIHKRPGLYNALTALRAGEAEGLIVTKLDRLSRNTAEFCVLCDDFKKSGWNLVVLSMGVDFATPTGKLFGTILAGMGEWERSMIGERTSDALQALKAAGVPLGARAHREPKLVPEEIATVIRGLSAEHLSTRKIARHLDLETSFRPPRGGRTWSHTTVAAVLKQPT